MATTLIDTMRTAVRISSKAEAISEEIEGTIEACKLDLKAAGVVNIDESDALIVRAIRLYCRADFNYNGKGQEYREAYDLQKMSLSLDSDYNEKKGA